MKQINYSMIKYISCADIDIDNTLFKSKIDIDFDIQYSFIHI